MTDITSKSARASATLELTADARPRFLRAIAEHVNPALVEEVHLFSPIRQGGKESGVAVVAARQPRPADDPDTPPDAPDDSWLTTDPPLEEDSTGEIHPNEHDPGIGDGGEPPENPDGGLPNVHQSASPSRLTIWRASYRWTLKGVDRGKWEVDIVAEADAPLITVDEVVRGVSRRAGEATDPERITGDEFRAALHAS
jgi:hypothetical protein